ncbi:MAG TPA: ATP-binding protein [Flavipsychrobacter sp.]|nr:ATP-binding protein [Flavipsychrobacter sp.]
MKISVYIFLSFVLILLLFTVTTYMNYKQSEEVQANNEYVQMSGNILRNTTRFQRNVLNMVSGLRGFLLTGERYFIESYDTVASDNEAILKELTFIIPDTSIQRARLQEIIELHNKWVETFAEPLRQAKLLSTVSDSNLRFYKALYQEKIVTGDEKNLHKFIQEKFRVFSNYEYEMRNIRRRQLAETVQTTKTLSFSLTFLSVVASFVIIAYITYRISSRINLMVSFANQIAIGNYGQTIKDTHNDELSKLSRSLNEMSEALSENITELRRKNEELDQFAHIVSHDLKGPLRGIDNVVTWMEEDHQEEMSPKLNHYLQLIKGRIVRAENLIEGVLSYARIDKETIPEEEVKTKELVYSVFDNVDVSVPVSFTVQDNMPVLFTERLPLFQVFANLISNAIKYNDKERAEVHVYFHDHEEHYEFFVADNGPGIAPQYHERIFRIFQTLKDRDTFESTGVGLSIIKKILDSRNETISIDSHSGNGAIFSFTWKKQNNG